ncbi:hypothetical protein LT493_32895 [Streptomyces tricolor]|nr:hypothetical protein [Streptomyces tricolor]
MIRSYEPARPGRGRLPARRGPAARAAPGAARAGPGRPGRAVREPVGRRRRPGGRGACLDHRRPAGLPGPALPLRRRALTRPDGRTTGRRDGTRRGGRPHGHPPSRSRHPVTA